MSEPQRTTIAELILTLLPDDGTPVANRIMRTMLTRALESRLSQDSYFEAVELLERDDRIGRTRGRGGGIFLSQPAPSQPVEKRATVGQPRSEADLMGPTKEYLERTFARALDLPTGSSTIVADISTLGPRKGQWARPDFLLVSVMPFQLMPGRQVDVHSFELKAEYGGSTQAVHEALAQTRFTHFGHLIWHVPTGSKTEAKIPEIEEQCALYGLGLIIIRDVSAFETWEILLDPTQKATTTATVDAFLMSRLPPVHQARLRDAVRQVQQWTGK